MDRRTFIKTTISTSAAVVATPALIAEASIPTKPEWILTDFQSVGWKNSSRFVPTLADYSGIREALVELQEAHMARVKFLKFNPENWHHEQTEIFENEFSDGCRSGSITRPDR